MFLKRLQSLVITFITCPVIQQWNWLRRRERKISRNWTPRRNTARRLCKNREGESSRDPSRLSARFVKELQTLGPVSPVYRYAADEIIASKRISIDSRKRDLSRWYINWHKLSAIDAWRTRVCRWIFKNRRTVVDDCTEKMIPLPVNMNPRIHCCFDNFGAPPLSTFSACLWTIHAQLARNGKHWLIK